MTKIGKELLIQLTSETESGPFVTIMLNTHVAHQEVEKDQLKLKNFAKEAKKRFEKKYPEDAWSAFQGQIDQLMASQNFWRSATTSVALIFTPEKTFVHRLSIRVDDQYYVGDEPYLLAIIKNSQFNYDYFLLALNRDSFSLYENRNHNLVPINLPASAPTTLEKALGEELDKKASLTHSSGEGNTFHSTVDKGEEQEKKEYQNLANRKWIEQLADIKQAASLGRISDLFISTANLVDGYGEDPEQEYDWRQELNHLANEIIRMSGSVYLLDTEDIPMGKKILAILRY